MLNILTFNIQFFLKIIFSEKQKARIILFLPASVATRNQAAALRMGKTPGFNLPTPFPGTRTLEKKKRSIAMSKKIVFFQPVLSYSHDLLHVRIECLRKDVWGERD